MQRSPPFDSHMHPHPHLMSASQPMGAMKQQQMGVHQQEGEQALAQPLCHLAGTSSTQHMQAPVSTSLQAGSSPGMHTPSVNGRQGSSLTDAGSMPLSQIQMAQYQETPFAVRVYRGDFGPSPNSTASAPPTATATAAAHTTAGGSQGSPAVCVTAPAAQPVGAVGSRGGDRSPAMLGQRQEQPQREQQGQPERDRSRGAQSTLCEAADPVEQPPEDAGGHEHAASREGVQPSTAVTGPGSQVDAHVMMLVNTTGVIICIGSLCRSMALQRKGAQHTSYSSRVKMCRIDLCPLNLLS